MICLTVLPSISINLIWHSYRYGNGMNATYTNWIHQQCAKWGRVTFGKEPLKGMLTANDRNFLKRLKDFCSERKLKMRMDSTQSLFTFQIKANHIG
jgi:hypothetical protein